MRHDERSFEFECPVEIGSTGFSIPAEAIYTYTPVIPATRWDPKDGGVELIAIYVEINGEQRPIEWTDESWIDDVIQDIYRKENGND